ncbi:hypothetical protein MLD38_012656 [Melastoma candidum]|uniref:Uncharacterized protein n=1 Tax=Melastoma candidum TaxID=119954 RepID=A0ACB9RA49_9MYRT|nr:hypothetical protein MLD38_012656 [Melastoma candidum]
MRSSPGFYFGDDWGSLPTPREESAAATMSTSDASRDEDDCREEEYIHNDEALDMLDKYWFFGKIRDHKTSPRTMLRGHSHPCGGGGGSCFPAPPGPEEELSKDAESVAEDEDDQFGCEEDEGKSLLDCYAEIMKVKGGLSDPNRGDERERLPPQGLVRAPSLPPDIGRAELFREEEASSVRALRMNMPRRQVSLNLSDIRPPRHSSKGMLQSSSAPRYQSDWYPNSIKSKKSMSDLEKEEVQGFKDLGFSFDDEDMNQNLVSILPGLQEKSSKVAEQDKHDARRPYLSEAWIAQCDAPLPIPRWNAKGSPEDMKAHIKHWARSVASNVL